MTSKLGSNFIGKTKTVVGVIFVVLAVLGYNHRSLLKMLLFVSTDGFYGSWPDIKLTCEKPDFDKFLDRLIPTPHMTVKDVEECFAIGEKLKHPLICNLASFDVYNPKAIMEAIKADPTLYQLVCREGGDHHWISPPQYVQGNISSILDKPSWCGAAFIYGGTHHEMLAKVIPHLNETFEGHRVLQLAREDPEAHKKMKVDTTSSFVSNYPEPIISTGSHAALALSNAFQLEGTKIWIMHTREKTIANTVEYYFRGSWNDYPNCLDTFFKGVQEPYVATTRPGDILYFPFSYEHLVFTGPGYNIMTNIRKIFVPKFDYIREITSIESIIKIGVEKLTTKPVIGNPRDASETGIMKVLRKTAKFGTPKEEREAIKVFGKMMWDKYR
jgi:hypothetical protein